MRGPFPQLLGKSVVSLTQSASCLEMGLKSATRGGVVSEGCKRGQRGPLDAPPLGLSPARAPTTGPSRERASIHRRAAGARIGALFAKPPLPRRPGRGRAASPPPPSGALAPAPTRARGAGRPRLGPTTERRRPQIDAESARTRPQIDAEIDPNSTADRPPISGGSLYRGCRGCWVVLGRRQSSIRRTCARKRAPRPRSRTIFRFRWLRS